MTRQQSTQARASYFDMQAAVGVSKHTGGLDATRELLNLCQVEAAHDVLEVGCGIGVGLAHIADTYGCRVVGVDISAPMLRWAHKRVVQAGVADKVSLRRADVGNLPFPDDQFDVVLCESVMAFVEDKQRAISECVRVTRPGGYVGLNEGLWLSPPTESMVERVKAAIGPSVPTEQESRTLWESSGLTQRTIRIGRVEPRAEVRSRIRWIGLRWMLRAWGRALRLYLANPGMRQAIKNQFDVPMDVFEYAGYGLFVGRKPTAPASP